jgi:hypothetical protein
MHLACCARLTRCFAFLQSDEESEESAVALDAKEALIHAQAEALYKNKKFCKTKCHRLLKDPAWLDEFGKHSCSDKDKCKDAKNCNHPRVQATKNTANPWIYAAGHKRAVSKGKKALKLAALQKLREVQRADLKTKVLFC